MNILENLNNGSVAIVQFPEGRGQGWEEGGVSVFYRQFESWFRIIDSGFLAGFVAEDDRVDYDEFSDQELQELVSVNNAVVKMVFKR